ncbi:MAG: glycosyltransferase family 1 protein [Negativicutes bacterium]|nr:glycosyltransferase family 1 protein [Negativicutes bacterium]
MKKVIKVLQVGMTENIGGMETYLIEYYRNLDRTKMRYSFVNITAERKMVFAEEIKRNGDSIYNVISRHRNPLKHYWQWLQLMAKHGKDYDALVLNTCSLNYVFPLVVAKLYGIKKRIIHSHNSGDEVRMTFKRKVLVSFNRVLFQWAATDYWACSKLAGEWMFSDKKDFTVIHNAVNAAKFKFNFETRQRLRNELGLNDKFVVGNIGRFSYQKNHEFLIDIFREVKKVCDNSVLLLIGDSDFDLSCKDSVMRKIKELNLEKDVVFLGVRNDVNDLIHAMDCFILPSHFEGLPIVGIETQAAGLPCFFADTITQESKITNLVHFISLDSSPGKWAEKILSIIPVKRKDMSKEVAEAGYDIRKQIKHIESLFFK